MLVENSSRGVKQARPSETGSVGPNPAPPPPEPAGERPAVNRLSWRLALLLVLLFLVIKLPFLFFSPYTIDEEEVKPGAIGYLLLTDWRLPLSQYVLGGYEGGALVVGIASIPFQALLGTTVLSYKIMALCVTLGILLLGAALLSRIGGPLAGLLAGLLVVASPPYLTQFQFILWGNYLETVFLTLLAMYLFHGIVFEGKDAPLRPLLLGLVCGLGVFIHYGFAVTPVALLLIWYWTDHRLPARRALWLFLAGIAAGFSPWIAYNVGHGFAGMDRVSDGLAAIPLSARAAGFLDNLKNLLVRDYAMTWHFKDLGGVPGRATAYLYWAFILVGLGGMLCLLRRSILAAIRGLVPLSRFDLPKTPETGALLVPTYLAGYVLVFCGTDYGLLRAEWGAMDPETHAHIFITLYFLLFALAWTTARLAAKNRWSLLLVVPPIIMAAVGNGSLLDFSRSNREYLARDFAVYADSVYTEIGALAATNDEDWSWLVPRLEGPPLVSFYYGLGRGFGTYASGEPERAVARCNELEPGEPRFLCLFGVGSGAFERYDVMAESIERGMAGLAGPERRMVLGGAAEMLFMAGFEDHPYIDEARAYFFADEFEARYPPPVVQYLRSRLSPFRDLSAKR